MKQKQAIGLIRTKAVDKDNGTFKFVASGIKEDRYGERIMTDGWIFKNYKNNPVMLWGHDHSIPAIAKVTKIWTDDKQVYAEAKWAGTAFAQEIRQLVEGGFLNTVSVSFRPLEKKGEWPNYTYTKQELLEISVVNVPAYAEAVITEAKSLGLNEVVKCIGNTCPAIKANNKLDSLNKKISNLTKQLDAKSKENAKSVSKKVIKKVEVPKTAIKKKKVEKEKINLLRIADKAIEKVLRDLKNNE